MVLSEPAAGGRERVALIPQELGGQPPLVALRSVPGSGRGARGPDPRTRVLRRVGGGVFFWQTVIFSC